MTNNDAMAQQYADGQQKRLPTLEDLIPGGETYRFTEDLYGVQWWGDICIKPGIDSLYSVNPRNGKQELITTRDEVNRVLGAYDKSEGDRTDNAQNSGIRHFYNIEFPWPDKPYMLIKETKGYMVYDFEKGELLEVYTHAAEHGGANIDFSPQGRHMAYTVGNNLYVDDSQVTDEPDGILCGQSVHRNEFGITKGTFWSPKGTLLAFYRMDETMVTQYPLVDVTARVGRTDNIRYPMAGMTSHKVQIGIYNPQTGETIYLDTGDPTDRYFTNIAWSPDEKSLYLIELNREQNHSKLCRYDAATGKLEELLIEEKHPKYVEPQQPVVFLPWDETMFIYQSQCSGYNHLYIYGTEADKTETQQQQSDGSTLINHTPQLKQLTQGDWLVQRVLGFNAKKKEIFFTATRESPLQSNIYKVSVKTGEITLLDNGTGVHSPSLSVSGTYILDKWSSPQMPRAIDLLAAGDGKQTARLLTACDPFDGLVMPSVEVGTIKAADGTTDLYWRMLKPAGFDPAKKYPVIVYVYGGPHAQMIIGNWMYAARGWDLYMANRGYIMFTLDNRGSANRGLEFENCTFRHLGVEEGKDQALGVDFLKSLPYVDTSRIGIHGWSFGGYMTTAQMLRYPDLYKVGVAGGPVIDWKYYEVMYGERYMDTPQDNPVGYQQTDLKQFAHKLEGHLLIIHDDHDDTCVPQHTLSFIKACVDARTYPDLFIYPCHKHNVSGRDRVHLHEKITRYFDDNL